MRGLYIILCYEAGVKLPSKMFTDNEKFMVTTLNSMLTEGNKMNEHKWTVEEDKIALYLYRFGTLDDIKRICVKLPMGYDSFKMRVDNFKYLATGTGLKNYSKQSKEVYDKYKDSSKKEFELGTFL